MFALQTTPCVDNIYKERNRLKQEKIDIQNNIKNTIDSTDTQIRKLKNKLKVLENKKTALIIEYNKECEIEERIRGTTPTQINKHSSMSVTENHSNIHNSPKTKLLNRINQDENNTNRDKELYDIKNELERSRFSKIIETMMEKKMGVLEHKLAIQEKERQIEKSNNETNSGICRIM
jgi:hypothetical protein